VLRAVLDALTVRMDGHRSAANTIARKRAVVHTALSYAVETGLLEANRASQVSWRAPKATGAMNPQTAASPARVEPLLAAVTRDRPELTAFLGCLYYAALRPEEATALPAADCDPSAAAWETHPHQDHAPDRCGLKHRPEHAIRIVPVPPALVILLRRHHDRYGTADDGRLFPGSRGGMLSEKYLLPGPAAGPHPRPAPATTASGLARRPYDLRHAALSLWLNAGAPPPRIAARAGHSVTVLPSTYAHCIDGQDEITNRQIEHALNAPNRRPARGLGAAIARMCRSATPPPATPKRARGATVIVPSSIALTSCIVERTRVVRVGPKIAAGLTATSPVPPLRCIRSHAARSAIALESR
jgi:integrase